MVIERVRKLKQLVEACHYTDNSDLEAEKTAAIEELLTECELGMTRLPEKH